MGNTKADEILQEARLKRTSGRLALLNVLLEAGKPLSSQEIASRLAGEVQFNHVSVYRFLDLLQEIGIVHRIEAGDRVWRFALCECRTKGHCHPHFICRKCGRTECLKDMNIPEIKEELGSQYQVEEKEYYLRGLCAACAGKE